MLNLSLELNEVVLLSDAITEYYGVANKPSREICENLYDKLTRYIRLKSIENISKASGF